MDRTRFNSLASPITRADGVRCRQAWKPISDTLSTRAIVAIGKMA
jgi:hypothetical protein